MVSLRIPFNHGGPTFFTKWWSGSDHFDWVTGFLRGHGLIRTAQKTMAVVCGSALTVIGAMIVGQRAQVTGVLVVYAVAALFVSSMTVFWLTRWPTRSQSEAAIVAGTLCIAAASLLEPDPTLGTQAPAAFAVTGAYVAFFHSTRLVVLNAALAVVVTTFCAVRLASATDIPTAVVAFWLVFFANLVMPAAIGALARAMGTYASRANDDYLTGLLNRRGFVAGVTRLLAQPPHPDHRYLVVLLADLDAFKAINDTHGHAVGDDVLVGVAHVLRLCCPPHAVVGRTGGEEFVIALTSATPQPTLLATRLCGEVAGLPYQPTVSIGIVSNERSALSGTADLERLLVGADAAMYAAKRRGGN